MPYRRDTRGNCSLPLRWALRMRRVLGVLALILLLVALAAAAGLVWGRSQLRGSLPQIDGERQMPGLAAPVRVTRDALGIPTIYATNRTDAARATGFLHAQDRFFQMDLSRRRAAGELAALVGRSGRAD